MIRRWGICLALFLLALQGQPQAAVSIVDSCYQDDSNGDTIVECTLTGVQAGDAIAAFCLAFDTGTSHAFSDDRSNTYNTPLSSGNGRLHGSYALNVAAGTTVVRCTTTPADFKGVMAVAIRPIPTSAAVEDFDIGTGTGTSVTTPAITATSNGIVVACMTETGNATITPDGAWTQLEEDETFTNVAGNLMYRLSTASNNYTPTWTLGTGGIDWNAVGFQFKELVAVTGACCLGLTGAGGR